MALLIRGAVMFDTTQSNQACLNALSYEMDV